MAASYSFRKALNGFHREDVVHHLEFINNKHANQVNQLKSDLDAKDQELQRLRTLEGVQEQLEQLRLYCDNLEQERSAYEGRIAALTAELELEREQKAQVICRNEQELEAYRRAERLERQAQQRAELLWQKANGIVADASAKTDDSARRIRELTQQVNQQLDALQQELLESQDTLKDAAAALCTIRPEEA